MRSRLSCSLLATLVVVTSATACGGRAPRAPAASALPSTVRVGSSGHYPPFTEWKGERPEGFVPSVVESFASATNVSVQWTRFDWSHLLGDMRAGRFDIAGDGITVTPERSIAGRFSVAIARGPGVLLLRRPAWAQGLGHGAERPRDAVRALDRKELRVVVNKGGYLDRLAHALFHAASIRPMPGNEGLRQALESGEADAAMSDTFEAVGWAQGIAGIERIGPLGYQTIALWVRPDDRALAERLDGWLVDEEEAGRLGALRASLLGPGGGADTAHPVDAILDAILERLALAPYVAAAKKRANLLPATSADEEREVKRAGDIVAKAAARRGAPAPPRAAVDGFFRAEVDAARVAETGAPPLAEGAQTYDLDGQLRPAIDRIVEKIALLVARLPAGITRDAVLPDAREELSEAGLDEKAIDRIADGIAALGKR